MPFPQKRRAAAEAGKNPATETADKIAAKARPSLTEPPVGQPGRLSQAELDIPTCRGEVWDRIVRIHMMINRGERFNATDLIERLGWDQRTIEPTLRFMRDRLEMPVEYDRPLDTYYYLRPYPYLPVVRVDSDESFLLKLLGQLVPAFVGSPFTATLKQVLKKFSLVVGGSNAFTDGLSRGVVFPFVAPSAAECRYLQVVSDAMDAPRELEVDYQKADATAPAPRLVHPLDFGYFDNRWVVLVHDVGRVAARTFRLDRIHRVRSTGKRFERPTDYDPAALLSGNSGAYTGKEDHEIRLLLSDYAAKDARSRKWHRSQTELERDGGRREITLRLNNLVDITRQILYWT